MRVFKRVHARVEACVRMFKLVNGCFRRVCACVISVCFKCVFKACVLCGLMLFAHSVIAIL